MQKPPRSSRRAAPEQPPFVLALEGEKGGTGKSTIAASLIAELMDRGVPVLGVDCDPQGTLTRWAKTASDSGRKAPIVLASADPRALQDRFQGYGVVVLDCPGRLDATQRSALAIADLCILPCLPSPTDLWALKGSVAVVRKAQALRPALQLRVLLNQTKRGALTALAREAILAAKFPLFGAELGRRDLFPQAVAAGAGPSTFKPRSPAADEVRALTDELLTIGRIAWPSEAAATASP